MSKLVATCGKFDPLHEGHVNHIIQASKLGDYMIIITHPDYIVAKFSKKGRCYIPLATRKLLLEGLMMRLGINGSVVVSIDTDGSVVNTLRMYGPDVFVRGGDRTPDNMPKSEIDCCKEIGCEIVYGVGDVLNSSSGIVKSIDGCIQQVTINA